MIIVFDFFYYGESGGIFCYFMLFEISMEDFSVVVDYLIFCVDVDLECIGILGICGWGGFVFNVVVNDFCIKVMVIFIMYDMSWVNVNGYFDVMSFDDCYKLCE